jgi:hypothetical protein
MVGYMKKKLGWTLALITLLFGGAIYYFITASFYEPTEDLFDFPTPIKAELVKKNEHSVIYNGSSSSEEYGIPLGYKLAIKANGWKKIDTDDIDASPHYLKGNHQINVLSSTKQLTFIIEK